jgi:transposase-like protein
VDTSAAQISTDTLDRRSGPRRRRTEEEKRRIVEETLRGVSIAVVAGRHELNANVVFSWRRLFHKGLLGTSGGREALHWFRCA